MYCLAQVLSALAWCYCGRSVTLHSPGVSNYEESWMPDTGCEAFWPITAQLLREFCGGVYPSHMVWSSAVGKNWYAAKCRKLLICWGGVWFVPPMAQRLSGRNPQRLKLFSPLFLMHLELLPTISLCTPRRFGYFGIVYIYIYILLFTPPTTASYRCSLVHYILQY